MTIKFNPKSALLLASLAVAIFTAPAFAETSFEAVKAEAKALVQVTKDYAFDKRDELVAYSKASLEKIDTDIGQLEVRIRNDWGGMM
ncbi:MULTISPECIES: hypothetical protein [Frigidibacter]|uniref:Uncharacterized protein n=1 Tax=Frigidibacter mobilis TaxID=1335048 RepID=A0A159Z3X1_9RHOB|nr:MULTISPECIES: hypothetical protein [Frigidibacter]AMY69786.1 hypothetical protein AKL17_2543 [Frigidibacter mobilis]MDP3340442.1 hypothetical protein [Frigidibacter sp.]